MLKNPSHSCSRNPCYKYVAPNKSSSTLYKVPGSGTEIVSQPNSKVSLEDTLYQTSIF